MDFLRPAYRDATWVEAIEISAVTTRENVRAHLVAEFATNLDVAATRLVIHSGDANGIAELDFSDLQSNLPIGASRLSDVFLRSGLHMRTTRPANDYELYYDSRCGRVELRMVMAAVTAPISGGDSAQRAEAPDTFTPDNDAHPGRIDQLVGVKGDLRIDDSFYTIACRANRIHRWGSGSSLVEKPAGTEELHFGDHLSVIIDAVEETPGWPTVRHAYVVRRGELRKVTAAQVSYDGPSGREQIRYELTDESGELHRVAATTASTSVVGLSQNQYAELRRLKGTWNDYQGTGHSVWMSDVRERQRQRRSVRRAKARAQEGSPE